MPKKKASADPDLRSPSDLAKIVTKIVAELEPFTDADRRRILETVKQLIVTSSATNLADLLKSLPPERHDHGPPRRPRCNPWDFIPRPNPQLIA